MTVVRVGLGDRSYEIGIGRGRLATLGQRVRDVLGAFGERAAVVTDSRVAEIHLDAATDALREAGIEPTVISIPEGEKHKSLAWLSLVYDRLVEARLDRGAPIVAVGGGVVGDLAGFAAATYLRGVPFVQVPTTLLAQVDASVGGKTAVNHSAGKNLIGAFHQPALVEIDVDTLRTLPRRELLAGVAEVVKYGATLDAELFARLEREGESLVKLRGDVPTEVIERCCAIKAAVVEADERESGRRAVLNFGHTVGHAIETLTDYQRYLHGEAVAIGMVAAARVSVRKGWLDEGAADRLESLLSRLGLPVSIPDLAKTEAVALAIEADKKASRGTIKFVALRGIGEWSFEAMTAKEIAELALAD